MYQQVIILLVLGDCRGLSLFNDDHPPFKRQPSIFRAVRYRSAVCREVTEPKNPGQGRYSTTNLELLAIWKHDLLLDGLFDQMKIWIAFRTLAYGVLRAGVQLQTTQTTVHRILRKNLRLKLLKKLAGNKSDRKLLVA